MTAELLCLRSYVSAMETAQFKGWKEWQVVGDPSPPVRGPNNARHQQGDATATPITTLASPLPPKQQMLTFENSKYYHKMIHSGIFFLVRSDTFPMASSSLRRGLPSRNPEERGRRQTLSGLHMCHLPCRLLNNWFLIIFRHF